VFVRSKASLPFFSARVRERESEFENVKCVWKKYKLEEKSSKLLLIFLFEKENTSQKGF